MEWFGEKAVHRQLVATLFSAAQIQTGFRLRSSSPGKAANAAMALACFELQAI
jgi:hypothetical protein